MPLRDRAILEVDRGESETATFEFRDGFEQERSITHNYLVSGRGQYLQEIWDQLDDFTPEADDEVPNRRAGYHVDGGAGEKLRTLTFVTGNEPTDNISWGDGESATGPSNVTRTDASGAQVSQYDRADIFEYWMAEARTDSTIPGRLYYNQWADGTYADEAGVYGSPMPVAVREASISTDLDEPTAVSGQVVLVQTNVFVEQGDVVGAAQDALDEVLDFA